MYATLFLRPDFTCRSRQLYVILNLPPWNHSKVGYFQSKTFVHGWNHSSSFAASVQNASGSSTERLYSAAYSLRRAFSTRDLGGRSSFSACKSCSIPASGWATVDMTP